MIDDERWAPLLRLHEQYRAVRDQSTRDTIDAAITREVNAIFNERPSTGTIDTVRDNLRRLDRNRGRLEREVTPLMSAANDPWPDLDRRMDRDKAIDALKPKTRATLALLMHGCTYAEAATALDEPVGTLKSRVSRAKGKLR